MPYGFPSGAGLRDHVSDWLWRNGHNKYAQLRDAGFDRHAIASFYQVLKHGEYGSIDSTAAHHPTFIPIAKAAIAIELLAQEASVDLFPLQRSPSLWYQHLADYYCKPKPARFSLSIITYNYDCTLERYVYGVMRGRHIAGRALAARWKRLNICHVHGSLLPDACDWHSYREYPKVLPRTVEQSSNAIQILPETKDSSGHFKRARQLLSNATDVFFLGFGFNATNLERLGVGVKCGKPSILESKRVFATHKGISKRIWGIESKRIFRDTNLVSRACTVNALMSDYRWYW